MLKGKEKVLESFMYILIFKCFELEVIYSIFDYNLAGRIS